MLLLRVIHMNQFVLLFHIPQVHKVGTYTNCYTGDEWDKSLCPDPDSCSQNCALDSGSISDYESTYGISTSGDAVTLQFVTGSNVGSRTYLLDSDGSNYKMFQLLNQEFTFDVDVSTLPCGLNGALYFVEMDQDGGTKRFVCRRSYIYACVPACLVLVFLAQRAARYEQTNRGVGWTACRACACSEMRAGGWLVASLAPSKRVLKSNALHAGSTRCNDVTCGVRLCALCCHTGARSTVID